MSAYLPVNPVIIYDAQSLGNQSLLDAQWYWRTRFGNNSYNLIGINFSDWSNSNTAFLSGYIPQSNWASTSSGVSLSSVMYGGNVVSGYAGLSMAVGIANYFSANPSVDAVFCSTYTPVAIFPGYSGNYGSTLAGYIGCTLSSGPLPIPNGRLGAPLNNQWQAETVPRGLSTLTSGISSSLYLATTNAIAAEKKSAAALNAWGSSTLQYIDSGGQGISAANSAANLAYMNAQNLPTVDLGGSSGTFNVNYNQWLNGTLPAGAIKSLFSLLIADPDFNNDTALPGAHLYSNSYTCSAGAWGFTWTSFGYYFACDLMYNGGSGAISAFMEPLAQGLRDPGVILPYLITHRAALCTVPSQVAYAFSYPYPYTVADEYGEGYGANVTAIGDPLYRPYASTALPANSAGVISPTFGPAGGIQA